MTFQSRVLYSIIFSALFFSCTNNVKNDGDKRDSISQEEVTKQIELDKFWVKYNFTEQEVNQYPEMIEQSLVDYIAQFYQYKPSELQQSLRTLITKSASDSSFYSFLHDKFSYYLYHPNSPMRNDMYYEQVLKAYLSLDSIQPTFRERDKMILDLVQRNQVGSKATDFVYMDIQGDEHKMSDFKAKYKLLVFYDPTCSHCNQVIQEMKNSEALNNALKSSEIEVLAVDVIGNVGAWKNYQNKLSPQWLNGIDQNKEVQNRSLYNILAYPTLYLLDENDQVLMKDAYFSLVENLFSKK